jgi:RNA polymerase sigma-70 factor (ECF subfamily)
MASADTKGPWMEAGREAGLVLSAQQGDRACYLELAEHYTLALYRLAHALTLHPDDAIDLSRETLIHGWKNIEHLPVGRPFYPWLMRAARNLSIAIRRRRAGHGESPLRGSARTRAFLRAFGQLTPDEQVVLVMRVVDGLSYQDIASALELPTRTAMSRISAARERLRAKIAERARKAA